MESKSKQKVTKVASKGSKKELVSRKTVCMEQLIDGISTKSQITKKEIKNIIRLFIDGVRLELQKGNPVYIAKFVRFSIKTSKSKTLINPKTKKSIQIPEHKKIFIKLCDYIKQASDDLE